jgi:hypothetical protein
VSTRLADLPAQTDPVQRGERVSRRVTRWMTAIALVPAPLWLSWAILRDPGPVWRAQYFGNRSFEGQPFVRSERELSIYWDDRYPTVEGSTIPGYNLSARWDTCLRLDRAREIPFQLVSDGVARFSIDGQERLQLEDLPNRGARGEVLRLEAGVHRLLVEMSAESWGSVALNASFDGRAPVALGSGTRFSGVSLRHPAAGDPACP